MTGHDLDRFRERVLQLNDELRIIGYEVKSSICRAVETLRFGTYRPDTTKQNTLKKTSKRKNRRKK